MSFSTRSLLELASSGLKTAQESVAPYLEVPSSSTLNGEAITSQFDSDLSALWDGLTSRLGFLTPWIKVIGLSSTWLILPVLKIAAIVMFVGSMLGITRGITSIPEQLELFSDPDEINSALDIVKKDLARSNPNSLFPPLEILNMIDSELVTEINALSSFGTAIASDVFVAHALSYLVSCFDVGPWALTCLLVYLWANRGWAAFYLAKRRAGAPYFVYLALIGGATFFPSHLGLPESFTFAQWADWSYKGINEASEPEHLPMDQRDRLALGLKTLGLCLAIGKLGSFLQKKRYQQVPAGKKKLNLLKINLDTVFHVMSEQPWLVVMFAPLSLLVEYALPHAIDYPFMFDALTYDEMVRIVLSPLLVLPMIWGVMRGLSSQQQVSWDSLLKRVKGVANGSVVSLYAGLFEELAFRWMAQPIAMFAVYGFITLLKPVDIFVPLGLSSPAGTYVFEGIGRLLALCTFNTLDSTILLVSDDQIYRYGVYLVDISFALVHYSSQGFVGVLSKPIGCAYFRRLMYSYGFVAVVFSHVMWDWWLMAGDSLTWLLAAPFKALFQHRGGRALKVDGLTSSGAVTCAGGCSSTNLTMSCSECGGRNLFCSQECQDSNSNSHKEKCALNMRKQAVLKKRNELNLEYLERAKKLREEVEKRKIELDLEDEMIRYDLADLAEAPRARFMLATRRGAGDPQQQGAQQAEGRAKRD